MGSNAFSAAYTLAALVHSKREDYHPETGARRNMYYINDGVYGSFNSILYDHAEVTPIPLQVRMLISIFRGCDGRRDRCISNFLRF